ncbi:pilus assembly protein TadB [Haloechinothrix sp. YIM 98757]|uniref:Pilus assembly protein TadB n=1 Tax=Haloechinothrix aidingensis TaxID=2752311 RepID=A0A838ADI4_9PSEU|nr:pilus assembly protein TadB [Haloechinothrix aidingensis]MBA0127273.1 pilus assembly protein TadB [Haloechinothrix aidingensis]
MHPPLAMALPGLALGLALSCALAASLPPAPVRLANALDRLGDPTRTRTEATAPSWGLRMLDAWAARAGGSTHRWWGIPATDLDLLALSPRRYLARRLTWAACGLALALALVGIAAVTGLAPPTGLALFAAPAGAVAGQAVPVAAVAGEAARGRHEFRRCLAVYLELVAQERASGAAVGPALVEAACVADAWPLVRLRTSMTYAEHTGQSHWQALADLGERIGVAELGELADIAASAADGAAIQTTLTATAARLRRSALAAETAEAGARSRRLALPTSLLLTGFVLLVLYPALARMLDLYPHT